MARGGGTYSRIVFWLKIVLPLVALALLSTVFLLSRDPETGMDIPLAQTDLRNRAERQQVTNPYFSGTTASGAQVSLFANAARPAQGRENVVEGETVESRITALDGTRLDITAGAVELDQPKAGIALTGGVMVVSSTGYVVETSALRGTYDPILAESDGAVRATGPIGQFDAGKMQLRADTETGELYLNFTAGVKLIYLPQQDQE